MIDNFKVIVSGFVFNARNELLVIRRSDTEESFPGMLAVPGGTVEVEPHSGLVQDIVESNLVREIKEETDIDVTVNGWMESSSIAKDKAKLYLFFKCQVNGNETPTVSEEAPEVFWINPRDINKDEATPALAQYITSLENVG
jgi:ADP-ribose pyrophosphatase YjhB (NUDIX family)